MLPLAPDNGNSQQQQQQQFYQTTTTTNGSGRRWPQVRVADEFVQLNSVAVLKCRRDAAGQAAQQQQQRRLASGLDSGQELAPPLVPDNSPADEMDEQQRQWNGNSLEEQEADEQADQLDRPPDWVTFGPGSGLGSTQLDWLTSDGIQLQPGEWSKGKKLWLLSRRSPLVCVSSNWRATLAAQD